MGSLEHLSLHDLIKAQEEDSVISFHLNMKKSLHDEFFNQTLLSMSETLDASLKQKWSQMVPAYNCTKNYSTRFSPYLLISKWERSHTPC